jgi:hypothetical protein
MYVDYDVYEKVFKRIIGGENVRRILKELKIPNYHFYNDIADNEELKARYVRSLYLRTNADADELDDLHNELIDSVSSCERLELIRPITEAYRIKSDNKKWTMARRNPRRYGAIPEEASENSLKDIDIKVNFV